MKCKCPSCRVIHTEVSDACPDCGFGFSVLDGYYGQYTSRKKALEAKLLTDKAGVLNTNERRQCKRVVIGFARRFPGAFFSVYLDSAQDHEEADSKSLWLLNKAHFTDLPEAAHSQFGILLYIDANKRSAALSYGAGFSPYLNARNTFSFLKSGHPDFYRGRYLSAVKKIVNKTTSHLSVKCPVIKKAHPHA